MVNILKILVWPIVVLFLGWRTENIFSTIFGQTNNVCWTTSVNGWDSAVVISNIIMAIGAVIAALIAFWAVRVACKTWNLESSPIIHAVGAFIITTQDEKINENETANQFRDRYILKENSPHTLQLVNVGRGPAINIVLSVGKNINGDKIVGKFLESICSHVFSLPANMGTRGLGEILRVHGQCFYMPQENKDKGDEVTELRLVEKDRCFDIDYEDCEGKPYHTEVLVTKVPRVDDNELNKVMEKTISGTKIPIVQVWKVANNESKNLK